MSRRGGVAILALVAAAAGCTSSDSESTDGASPPTSVEASVPPVTSPTSATSTIEAGPDSASTSASTEPVATTEPIVEPTAELEEPSPSPTFGPSGSTNVEIEGDAGTIVLGGGDVPTLVSETFPVPDDLVVRLASETGPSAGFSGTSSQPFDDVVDLYGVGLVEAGYAVVPGHSVPGVVAVFEFDGPDGRGQVAVSASPGGGGTDVLVTFER